MKLEKNQNYYDAGPHVTKNGKALAKLIEKLEHACSGERFDIVFNAIANLLVSEIAHRIDADQHQEFINLLAQNLTENLTEWLQPYLANEKMFAASGEQTDLQELTKHMN